jgi:hypothetical protein
VFSVDCLIYILFFVVRFPNRFVSDCSSLHIFPIRSSRKRKSIGNRAAHRKLDHCPVHIYQIRSWPVEREKKSCGIDSCRQIGSLQVKKKETCDRSRAPEHVGLSIESISDRCLRGQQIRSAIRNQKKEASSPRPGTELVWGRAPPSIARIAGSR